MRVTRNHSVLHLVIYKHFHNYVIEVYIYLI